MTQQEHKKQIKPRLDLPSARRREPKNIKKVNKNHSIDELFKMVNEEVTTENTILDTKISTDGWKKTFRKTSTIELANLVKNTTITHNSLLRMTGSYSTKMLGNLKLNNKIMSGIENKPSKVFYNKNTDIAHAINNHVLSYAPYFFNYWNEYNNDIDGKFYVDNLTIVNNRLFFSLFLDEENHTEVECTNITREDIITNNVKISDKEDLLKIVIVDIKNRKQAIDLLIENKKSNLVFMSLDKPNKKLHVYMFKDSTIIPFSHKELLAICKEKKIKSHDKQLYTDVRRKYEFERKVIKW